MADNDSGRQQPGPDGNDLEAIAVDLISAHVERIFTELDATQLVEDAGLEVSEAQKAAIAHLIDTAAVEMEIDFSAEDDHEHQH
jgi:hypothetical protein